MTRFTLDLLPLARRLQRSVGNARTTWNERRSLLLLLSAEGLVGLGEAAPLPGYSADTLEENLACLQALTGSLELDLSLPFPALLRAVDQLLPPGVPAAHHGLATALIDFVGQKRLQPAHELLREVLPSSLTQSAPLCSLPLNAVVSSLDPGAALESAQNAHFSGIRCVKVKVGRAGQLAQEVDLVRRLRDALPRDMVIRLDANQGWSPEAACAALEAFLPLAPALVEEPCALLESLPPSPLPLALDESLQQSDPAALLRPELRALVLKPSALGLVRVLYLAAWAHAERLSVIVSHQLEGPVGHASAAALALACGTPDVAQGLDTHWGIGDQPVPVPMLTPATVEAQTQPGLGFDADCRRRLRRGSP